MADHPIHEAHLPEEPPVGTVVLGQSGAAWQLRTDCARGEVWVRNMQDPNNMVISFWVKTWGHLLCDDGPVTELYRP